MFQKKNLLLLFFVMGQSKWLVANQRGKEKKKKKLRTLEK
jgi:hypothetical protein